MILESTSKYNLEWFTAMEYSFFHPRLSNPCPFSIDWLTWGLERLLTRRSFNLMETKLGTMGRTWTQRARAAVQSEAPRGGGAVVVAAEPPAAMVVDPHDVDAERRCDVRGGIVADADEA